MPIYEYVCHDCRDTFELLIRGDEKPSCPKCEGDRLEKQLSVTATIGHQSGPDLPVSGTCGRPQCGSGCAGLDN